VPSPHIHIPFNRIQEYSDVIKKHKLNLEIYFSSAVLDSVTPDEIHSIVKTLDHNPSLSIHAPFMDLSPGAVDSEIRKVTMSRFYQVLDISETIRPVTIVFHSGYEKWKYDLHMDLWLEKSLMTWQPLNSRAIDIGVKIAIENIFEDDPSNLKLLIENMDSNNFGICFDTGHLNIFSNVKLEDWTSALNPYIIELHLHDNDGKADQHLPVGEGSFDFGKFFGLILNRDCLYTVEAHSPENVIKSLGNLRKFTDF
jgi:sugar phosphate isomerase/epimerase